MDPRLVNAIAGLVSVAWAASLVADIIPSLDYDPSPYIHLIMMVVVGAAFGTKAVMRAVKPTLPEDASPPWMKQAIKDLFPEDEQS